jgi:flagellar biosynthesis protein FliR
VHTLIRGVSPGDMYPAIPSQTLVVKRYWLVLALLSFLQLVSNDSIAKEAKLYFSVHICVVGTIFGDSIQIPAVR